MFFKTKPYAHQLTALEKSAEREYFALFMDMGTGKTKVIIDDAMRLYASGHIDAVVVMAPNGVHRNWVVNEIPTHMHESANYIAAYYSASAKKAEREAWNAVFKWSDGLRWFCFNIESASNKSGQQELERCIKLGRVMFVIDESQRIKTPGAKRTKFILKLAQHAAYRRILSGTPITQSPLDFYSQLKFLDPTITGFRTFTGFRSHFAITEKRKTDANRLGYFEVVTGYQHIDELEDAVAAHCYRVRKKDCLDLPEKVFEKRYVPITPEQRRIYNQLIEQSVAILCEEYGMNIPPELRHADKEQLLLFFADKKVTAKNAMTKLLRLQQVLSGFVPNDEDKIIELIKSERINVLMDVVEETVGKIIIWARFRHDLDLVARELRKAYGPDSVVEYHGGIDSETRMNGVEAFQHDPRTRFFVAQPHSGGTGLTLTAAETVVYYTNDFSLEARLQSEDRAHRIGQKNNVTYIDLICDGTVDDKIIEALQAKRTVADNFNYEEKT